MRISPTQVSQSYRHRSFLANKCDNTSVKSADNPQRSTLDLPCIPLAEFCENQKYRKGQIVNLKGEVFNRHNTQYCRTDMNWLKLEMILRKKYPNPNDVNFVTYACSTGEEPYTIAILLNKIYKRPVPIKAFDISQRVIDENIKKQKEGVKLELDDFKNICTTLNLPSGDAFCADKKGHIKIDSKITNCVEYACSNILEDVDFIDNSKPTVLFARNMWPYVLPKEYPIFCKKLSTNLAPNSLFIIGQYDYEGEESLIKSNSFPRALSKNGFKPIRQSVIESFRAFNLFFEKK